MAARRKSEGARVRKSGKTSAGVPQEDKARERNRAEGQSRLEQGQEACSTARGMRDDPAICPEDKPLDPALVAQALEHFTAAAARFAEAGQPKLEALALLGQAEVNVQTPLSAPDARERLSQAEELARAAVERLDGTESPADTLRGYLIIAQAGRQLAPGVPGEQETRLKTLSAMLGGAAYLAGEHGDALIRARVHAEACRLLAERFESDRDENLLDAVAEGERAIALFREHTETRAFELPLLLHDLGNVCMKVAGERASWLARGRDWYREGAAAVNAERYPRLHRMLRDHLSMAEQLLEHRDYTLPEKEMVSRFATGVGTALKNQDEAQARSLSWGFLAWAWSLPRTPNVHVGEAHKMLARVASALGEEEEARHQLYHALGVLAAVLTEKDRWFYLVAEARDLFVQSLQRNGLGDSLQFWLARSAQSFVEADAACARGSRLIDDDRAGAMAEFEHAVNVFPCHPAARFYRGAVHLMSGRHAEALSDFDFVITLKPQNLRARVNRATVRLKLGDRDAALTDLDAAVEIDPANPDVRQMRAGLHEELGRRDKAAADIEVSLKSVAEPGRRDLLERKLKDLRAQ
ncbi:MAG: tetratricopeptide repeat protein [Parvibaculaceae bacterium]